MRTCSTTAMEGGNTENAGAVFSEIRRERIGTARSAGPEGEARDGPSNPATPASFPNTVRRTVFELRRAQDENVFDDRQEGREYRKRRSSFRCKSPAVFPGIKFYAGYRRHSHYWAC